MKSLPVKVLWIVLILVAGACRIASTQYELCSENPVCAQDHGQSTQSHGEHDCPNGHVCGCGQALTIDVPRNAIVFVALADSKACYWELAASRYEEPYRKIDHPPQLA